MSESFHPKIRRRSHHEDSLIVQSDIAKASLTRLHPTPYATSLYQPTRHEPNTPELLNSYIIEVLL